MDKLFLVGYVTGNREVAELPELDAYLQNGWRIKEIQATSGEEHSCCYVWLTKPERKPRTTKKTQATDQ